MMSKTLRKLATEPNVLAASAVFFFAHAILRRTSGILFANSGESFAFGADFSLVFGYAGSELLAATGGSLSLSGFVILVASVILNLISTASYAFMDSAIISWAVDSLGKEGSDLLAANQIPLVNMLAHWAETLCLFLTLTTGSEYIAALSSAISQIRAYVAIATLVVSAIASIQFLKVWLHSIGRDGRQKIVKKEQ